MDSRLPLGPLNAPRRSSNVIIKGGRIKVGLKETRNSSHGGEVRYGKRGEHERRRERNQKKERKYEKWSVIELATELLDV